MGSRSAVGFALVLALTLSAETARAAGAREAEFRAELALRYAPIHHQDVHTTGRHALAGAADYIAAYDFDRDSDASNNWDHAGDARFPLSAHAYYSVVETPTHWFITYQFFHPRDWSSTFFETEHENDSEGVLLTVARDGSRLGALRAAVTVVHADFYSYVPSGSRYSDGDEDIDGQLSLSLFEGALHPVTAQQAETHALKAWPYYRITQQGIVYYPSLTTAEVPASANDRHVLYQLHDMLAPGGLWQRRGQTQLISPQGGFPGNRSGGCGDTALWCIKNAAHASWAWDDHDDQVPSGAMAYDPARLVRSYFSPHERVSSFYSFNPFRL
ncbi:MAG TPA: hypothetical protein VHB79_21410 [Polyangiaceae bacterium]|nr:hypothetical protein [Polyangiaceae bacterium]